MAEVANELLLENLKAMQAPLAQVDGKIDELKQEMQASRTSQIAQRQESTGVHHVLSRIQVTLVRHEGRLDHIERRLELSDVPAP